ncbi:MAG: class III poly(R)-hydroxyalkanoic acid synthase subunit PhaE [Pseudoxanthomonas sp.]
MYGTGMGGGFGGLGGFGPGGFGQGSFGQGGDFESLARQYWSAWGQAMRNGAGSPAAATPDWNQAVQWWSQLLSPQVQRSPVEELVNRFQQQASDWYGRMQQVAAQFTGTDNNAADIGKAWREALGANAGASNPFADIFNAMKGWGGQGIDGWYQQVEPWLQSLQKFTSEQRLPQTPAFGLAREHQERWQAMGQALDDYRQRNNEYNALMMKIGEKAFALFEAKLDEHDSPGKQIGSARALFDLWIDAAEEAYAAEALSTEFRHAIGALSNAQMRLRGAVQKEVEQLVGLFGMPGRTEVDSAHRKIVELQREVRKLVRAQQSGMRPVRAQAEVATVKAAVKSVEPMAAPKQKVVIAKKAKPAATKKAAKPKPKPKQAEKPKVVAKPKPRPKPVAKVAPAKKAAPKKPAARKAANVAKKIATATPKTDGKVVSMKDWVARGMASIEPPIAAAKPTAKKRARK